jgi:hypothetical protein
MRKEFNILVELMQKYDLYQITDEVGIAISNLDSKITEIEKRLECARRSNQDSNSIIMKLAESFEGVGNVSDNLTYGDFEVLQRGVYDVDIALNFNDNEPIQENWYGLFEEPKKEEPKKEEPKVLIPKGAILEWEETIQYFSAKKGAKARVLRDYTSEDESNDKTIQVEWIDKKANNQENGGYYLDKFKEGFELPIPTYQCKNQHTFDKVKEVIQILKTLDNGDCVDGETMDYIVKELGFEEYLLRSLVMSADFKETKDLLREKFEVQI